MSDLIAGLSETVDAGVEKFKQAFASLEPQMDPLVAAVQLAFIEDAVGPLKEVKGDETYGRTGGGSLADLRMEVDIVSTTWIAQTELLKSLQETTPEQAKKGVESLGMRIAGLEAQVGKAPFVKLYDSQPDKKEDVDRLRAVLKYDTDLLRFMWNDLDDAAKDLEYGKTTGRMEGELVEAWNSETRQNELHHPTEWNKMKERRGFMDEAKTPLTKIKDRAGNETDVSIQTHTNTWLPASGAFLRWEREATEKMREGLTENVNNRTKNPKLKKGVENNCNMANKLAGLLTTHPQLLAPEEKGKNPPETGGLLNRIVGPIAGQGQFKKQKVTNEEGSPVLVDGKVQEKLPDPQVVIAELLQATERLTKGEGVSDDANKVQQFIACFIDGLTEVLEADKPTAKNQFDQIWPDFRVALGLEEGDKKKLLDRVKGYKEIAGAASDTLGGKGKRKAFTRAKPTASMPDDPRYKIEEENALLMGDISGSMHSQLLATELSESLFGSGPKIKEMGDSVQVRDKEVLDARAQDALAITAGGKIGSKDIVLHTAWEMINGMRAITGLEEIDQSVATYAMKLMRRGMSFTGAMERILPAKQIPWLATTP